MARATPTPEATLRGRIPALARAMRNGERLADDTELQDCRRQLAEIRLTKFVEDTVANWPRPSDEVIDRIVGLLRSGRKKAGDG
jgi:hypothetical protein